MTPRALLLQTAEKFRNAGIPDPETDSSLLLSYLCKHPPLLLRMDTDTEIPIDIMNLFSELAERRLCREPLQYITGETHFCGRSFIVDKRVLIPRPETQFLCHWALELPLLPGMKVLDLCCGSGCIGLTILAERPDLSVVLSDVSQDALDVAEINAAHLHLKASFHLGDLLDDFPDGSFDMILSNPPYIPTAECKYLQPEVLNEPFIALDGGTDGLSFYRKIVSDAARVLKKDGKLLLELGIHEAEPVRKMFEKYGFSFIDIRKDFSGIERLIMGKVS